MIQHRRIVGIGLRVTGVLLAIVPAIALVQSVIALIAFKTLKAPVDQPPPDPHVYGFWSLFDVGANGLGHLLYALGSVMAWLLVFAAAMAVAGLLVALLVYLTGRGVGRGRSWARVVGIAVGLLLLGASVTVMDSLPRVAIPLTAMPVLAALYSLWALIWRWVEPAPPARAPT